MRQLVFFLLIGAYSSFANSTWNSKSLADYLGYTNYSEVSHLSSNESWAILAYGFTDETDYQDINGYLRYGKEYALYNQTESSVSKLINDVKSAARKLPKMPKGLVVYRGFKLNWRNGKCFKVGEIISDKAFTSSTLDKKIAKHFAFNKESGKGAFLTIELASKQTGILITENEEAEVLLMPNRKITITESFEKDSKCFSKGYLN
jgi:hypothetical protein